MTAKSRFSIITKVAGILLATFVVCARAQTFSVQWKSDPANPGKAIVEVRGGPTGEDPRKLLTVHVVQENAANDLPMLGTYQSEAGMIRFTSQFPLQPGMHYKAVVHVESGAPIVADFNVPATKSEPSTVVSQIYPSASLLPENLLKFYVHFSAPMSAGGVYDHIHLLGADGKAVDLPFLQINEELWDPAMTRLTLIIDPGRIKRGVKPLVDIGPVLEMGKHFTLVVDADCKDASGTVMKQSFRKAIEVGPPDRNPPDPGKWKIVAPSSNSNQPLTIEFEKPMDHALALRMVDLEDSNHRLVDGHTELDQQERRWKFIPAAPWRAGQYNVVVLTTIEDLAGNNIGKAFDVDVFNDVQKQIEKSSLTLPIEIR